MHMADFINSCVQNNISSPKCPPIPVRTYIYNFTEICILKLTPMGEDIVETVLKKLSKN